MGNTIEIDHFVIKLCNILFFSKIVCMLFLFMVINHILDYQKFLNMVFPSIL